MQRRAAALYTALFLVVAAGAWGFVSVAQGPTVSVDDPDHTIENGSELTVNGRTYTVTGIEAVSSGGGGHGGGGGESLQATAEWTNESVPFSERWVHNGSVAIDFGAEGNATDAVDLSDIDRTEFRVLVPNESDPSEVTLREIPGEETTLVRDANNRTFVALTNDRGSEIQIPIENYADQEPRRVTEDNETYVLFENAAGGTERVPAEQYVPIDSVTFEEGDAITYRGQDATVSEVATNETARYAVLAWEQSVTNQVTLGNGAEVELGPAGDTTTYVVHFTSSERAALSTDLESYHEQVEERNRFYERTSGVWAVGMISLLAAIFLVGLAYLPRKE